MIEQKLKVLDLFSGIGGFSLGLERAGMETVAFCEIEPYCQKVLRKHWPGVPIFDDVRTLTKENLPDDIGLICGGYPCQPFSTAGKRAGAEDDRHLWPEMYRLIREIRPRWVVAENVAGHISMGLDSVLSDLEAADYTWWAFVIPACARDARHRRDRVWIVAHSDARHDGRCPEQKRKHHRAEVLNRRGAQRLESGHDVANTNSKRGRSRNSEWEYAENVGKPPGCERKPSRKMGIWPTEPDVGRVANGVPNRVDRLRGLGNAVLPQIPEIIGRFILEVEFSR